MLELELQTEVFSQSGRVLQRPKPAEFGDHPPDENNLIHLETSLEGKHAGYIKECVKSKRYEAAFQRWHGLAEDYIEGYLKLQGGGQQFERGRGKAPEFRLQAIVAPTSNQNLAIGAVDAHLGAVQALRRKVKELSTRAERREKDLREHQQVGARDEAHTLNLWNRIKKETPKILEVEASFAKMLDHPASPLPKVQQLQEFRKVIDKKADEYIEGVHEARGRKHIEEMGKDEKQKYGKLNWRTVREPGEEPIVVVQRADGSLTSNPVEMHNEFQREWLPKVFQRYSHPQSPLRKEDGKIDRPQFAAFKEKYGQYCDRVPFPVERTTGQSWYKQMQAMHPSASGLDNWSVLELKRLPIWVWDLFALVWESNFEEQQPCIPEWLASASAPVLSKGEGPAPLKQRILTVLPVLYRGWAAQTYRQLLPWQAKWSDEAQRGAKPKCEAPDVVVEVQLDVESALCYDTPLYLASLDYSKYYDYFVWNIMWPLMKYMGIPDRLARFLMYFYLGLKRYFKIGAHFSEAWFSSNSLAQGCPLSCMLANLLIAVWMAMLRAQVASIKSTAFLDDRTLRTILYPHNPKARAELGS